MGVDEKEFIRLFGETRKQDWDFTYMNIPNMEMYRNFEERVWSKKEKSKDNISTDAETETDSTDTEEETERKEDTDGRRIVREEAKKISAISESTPDKSRKESSRKKGGKKVRKRRNIGRKRNKPNTASACV